MVWKHGVNSQGYGTISVKGKTVYVHRAMYALTYGRLGKGRFCCHTCHNRRCIEPSHLYDGDPQSNYDDMRQAGNAWAWGMKLPKELDLDAESSAA